jgi:hypothetical protein
MFARLGFRESDWWSVRIPSAVAAVADSLLKTSTPVANGRY